MISSNIRKLDVVELEGDCDLFDDGSLRLLKTPGHSPGHQALILNLPQRGKICLGADVGHQKDGFEAMVPMPWDWSTSAMSLTRMRMKQNSSARESPFIFATRERISPSYRRTDRFGIECATHGGRHDYPRYVAAALLLMAVIDYRSHAPRASSA